jgi:uncharacterized protein YndB with AHSA1/START domain
MLFSRRPSAKTETFVRDPAAEVFEVFIGPAGTPRFWFMRLETRKRIRWDWKMYGFSVPINVKTLETTQTLNPISAPDTIRRIT